MYKNMRLVKGSKEAIEWGKKMKHHREIKGSGPVLSRNRVQPYNDLQLVQLRENLDDLRDRLYRNEEIVERLSNMIRNRAYFGLQRADVINARDRIRTSENNIRLIRDAIARMGRGSFETSDSSSNGEIREVERPIR